MGLYGGSAPKPDPAVGEAALASAKLGKQYLGFMEGQADITNEWAEQDRSRFQKVFQPLQDRYIARSETWDSPERKATAARQSEVDVAQKIALGQESNQRALAARGVNPASGAFREGSRRTALAGSLATAGAGNLARRSVEAEGEAMRANAMNMGAGFAVNPATSMGLSNGAMSSGFGGAIQGQGQKGSMLSQQYGNELQAYNSSQQGLSSLLGAAGTVAGYAMFAPSSKEIKKDKRPARGALKALDGMPVEEWTYKPGAGDGGRHVGTYAEDFQRETGKGDGKSIPIIDAIGVTMGAVKELNAKVDRLGARGVRPETIEDAEVVQETPAPRGVRREALA